MSEKASKGRFRKPQKLQNHSNPAKEKRRRQKSNGCTLNFYNSYFEDFGRKKLWDVKGPVGDNVFKNPARYI